MSAQDLKALATGRDKSQSPVAAFSSFMDKLKPQMALALPKHLTADRMARLALTAFSTSDSLQRCTTKSIAASIMTAGQLGLEPGVNGAGFLVPYGTTCTFVPGWKGLVDLVSRSGRGTVFTGVIFKDQEYSFVDGAKRDLIIHNETDLDDPADITHAYAIGWVKDASMPIIELWRVSKIKKHRDKYNKQGQKHYSFRDWEMYARKVPLLQVIKYMPCSIEVANAVALSDAADRGRGAVIEGGFVVEENETQGIGQDTGEIREEPHQIEEKQPKDVPQHIPKAEPATQSDWSEEDEANARAAEVAEQQQQQPAATRQRRERGSMGVE
jgi:recombination protein RecT